MQKQLVDIGMQRQGLQERIQKEVAGGENEPLEIMYNHHMINIKQIETKRKDNRAEFHIKQRDQYIEQLKQQLSLRDQITKEKLGVSVTNFMPGGMVDRPEIFTMQDIDHISNELIHPGLNMTKSDLFSGAA